MTDPADPSRPPPLHDARPDLNGPPPDDREVRIGAALQLLLSVPCVAANIQNGLGSSSARTATAGSILAAVGILLVYPALAAVALAGSMGRHAGRRPLFYGIYLAGTAAVIVTIAAAVVRSSPTRQDRDELLLGMSVFMPLLNPAAAWIAGRWVIFGLFRWPRPANRRPAPPDMSGVETGVTWYQSRQTFRDGSVRPGSPAAGETGDGRSPRPPLGR